MSKQVICVNPKNYRLTRNLEYAVQEVETGWYQVINDAGRSVRYASDLFQDVVVESTREDVLGSLTVTANDRLLTIRFTIDGDDVVANINRLTESGTDISCGIGQLAGLNGLAGNVSRLFNGRRLDLSQEVLNACIEEEVSNSEDCAFLLLSTNIENNEYADLISNALDPLCTTHITQNNPNSGNNITLWIIDKTN